MLDTLVKAFVELDEDKIKMLIQRLFKAKFTKKEILGALKEGLDIIGKKYEQEEYTLSDLMMAGILYEELMQMACFDLVEDVEQLNAGKNAVLLLGTIESDMHDIGKSLFKSVAASCGFQVVDLGINVKPEVFCEKIERYHPDIVGISIILTGAVEYLKKTIEMIEDKGLRKDVKIIIGGSVADDQLCEFVGADAYTNDATEGIAICQRWMQENE